MSILAIHKREGELFNNNNFGIRCLFFGVVGIANIAVGINSIFIANLILPNSINIIVIIIVNLTLPYNTIRHYKYITPLHVNDLA